MALSSAETPTRRNATDNGKANGRNGANGVLQDYYVDGTLPTLGQGRAVSRSTLVRTAQQRARLYEQAGVEVPNLVEMQLESYQWFLNTGLRELFDSFSPIEDFTGTMSLEFLDYTLGEPKFDPDECRERDLTYEMPMKVKVRVVNKETGELKESEVYLGELPCMTERGTFIINGAERVVVSQLSRSPGVYFKEEIAYSGRRLLQMQVIPHEGAWVDAEVSEEATKDISVSLGVKIEAHADYHVVARFFGD
jgi:DNA-directed RNA polymerase subunit beta